MKKRSQPRNALTGAAPRRVVILGLPPVDALDVIGPAEAFSLANHLRRDEAVPYSVELVSAGADLHMKSESGIGLMAHRTLAQERRDNRPIDTLIVASGFGVIDQLDNDADDVVAWIRTRAPTVRRVCSICVGAFVLAEAGLLDGRKATTHWRMAQQLTERYPEVKVDPDPIWVKDGNVYTSAGISSGIDLTLSLIGEDLGNDAALEIAKNLVLFLRRPGGQAQFSVTLKSQQATGSSLDDLCLWIGENLHTDLTVEILADRLAASVRTAIRMFQRELNTTPAKYVEDARIEAVCRALELGGRQIEEIARQCGYHSTDVLRKVFTRRIGVTPREYARRFAPDGGST